MITIRSPSPKADMAFTVEVKKLFPKPVNISSKSVLLFFHFSVSRLLLFNRFTLLFPRSVYLYLVFLGLQMVAQGAYTNNWIWASCVAMLDACRHIAGCILFPHDETTLLSSMLIMIYSTRCIYMSIRHAVYTWALVKLIHLMAAAREWNCNRLIVVLLAKPLQSFMSLIHYSIIQTWRGRSGKHRFETDKWYFPFPILPVLPFLKTELWTGNASQSSFLTSSVNLYFSYFRPIL